MSKVLGISAFYHDSAATILIDGQIIAAAQEERFSRIKHDKSYPYNAIEFCLKYANVELNDIDNIIFFEKPFLKFERLLETYVAFAPRGFISFCKSMPIWLREKLFQKNYLINQLSRHDKNFKNKNKNKNKIYFSEHHLSHAASAFYPSPFEEAIILTADGVGEWATTTVAVGKGNDLEIKKEIHFPHSLGLLYSSFTYYLGFKVNSGEYKVMGLSPYGKPVFAKKILEHLVDIKNDGSFHLNQKYFNYSIGLTMTNKKFDKLFGSKPRNSNTEQLTQFHMDIAASIQKVTEDIMLKMARSLKSEFNISNLCLAGGVALNCVVNGKILKEKIFENIWVQPAAGDAGGSLGAALAFWHIQNKKPRFIKSSDNMKGSYLGKEFTQFEIEEELKKKGANYDVIEENELIDRTSVDLKSGNAIGWFQGRSEFGPRALGSRSILADPRSTKMQKNLNLKVKFRESFRPFAPAILREDLSDWFDLNIDSPYMSFVAHLNKGKKIKMSQTDEQLFGIEKLNIKRSEIPAVTHVDYSARVQTVHEDTNSKFYKLIKKFKEKTKCPLILNTSFNVRGEPIVNSPTDAFNCFMGTNLDKLIIGNCYLDKKLQNKNLLKNYSNKFEKD